MRVLFSILLCTTFFMPVLKSQDIESKKDSLYCTARIDSIIQFALKQKGATYKYGSAGPKHFDCSGLVYYTFNHFGIQLYRSSREQYRNGVAVNREDIQKGDLVFFKRGQGIGHVGIVIETDGNGEFNFIHASTYKRGVCIDLSTREGYANTYVGARRIIVCDSILSSSDTTVNEAVPMLLASTVTFSDTLSSEKSESSETTSEKQEKTTTYIVKKGDTLYGIAKKNKVRVDDIKKWNNLKSDRINIGQKLKIKKR